METQNQQRIDAIVFGCGEYFLRKRESICKLYHIVAAIDNTKTGKLELSENQEVMIYTPEDGIKKFSGLPIIITAKAFINIAKQLADLGVPGERIVFSQNIAPFGAEGIVFNENKKIYFDNNVFHYGEGQSTIEFRDETDFQEICHEEEYIYKVHIPKVSYDEIEKMDLHIPKAISPEISFQNDYYSHAYWIKKYCGLSENYVVKATIEHACYMGADYVWDCDISGRFHSIITLSPKREEILKKYTCKSIYMLGPYMAYADYSKSLQELEEEKQRLGRTLVVFPCHSTDLVELQFDFSLFMRKIKELSSEFDTVRICMHYADILKKRYIQYEQEGFQVVSAGHMFDPMFLPRLKSILYCCNMIMSNDVGSYIGQAALLNKPCYLYRQKLQQSGYKEKRYIEEYITRDNDCFYNEMFERFSEPQDCISAEQWKLINYGWGNHLVKSPEELLKIMKEMEAAEVSEGD